MKRKRFEKMTCWAIEQEDGTLMTSDEDFLCTYDEEVDAWACCRLDCCERPIRIDIVRHRERRAKP